MQISPGEFVDMLIPFQPLDDYPSHHDNAPAYQSQAGAEERWLSSLNFSVNNDGDEFVYGPIDNLVNEGFSATTFDNNWSNVYGPLCYDVCQ